MRKFRPTPFLFLVVFVLFIEGELLAQCNFYSDYSNPNQWTQVGSEVEIVNGEVHFLNGAKDREYQKRLNAPLGKSLQEENCWQAQFECTPTAVGVKNNLPYAGHLLFGLTAGTNDVFYDCSDPPCTGHPKGYQDGIMVFYSAQNPPTGELFFHIVVRDSGVEYSSQHIVALPLGTTHFVKIEKSQANEALLSVFSDSSFTNHLPGSPVNLTYSGSVDGLTHAQHGNVIRGELRRELTGTLDNLCIRWAEIPVENNLPSDTIICPEDSLVLNAGSGSDFSYLWNTGSTDSVLTIDKAGTYFVSVSNSCAVRTDTIHVDQAPKLQSQLSDVSTCENQPAPLTYTAANATFLWNTGEISSTIYPTKSGLYSVEVTNNCEIFYDEAYVDFIECDCNVKLPNVFTPNNDGENDLFKPVEMSSSCLIKLTIFNRWGSVVFETTDLQFTWDGENAVEGTYFWVLEYNSAYGNSETENGIVTLLR